jgi:hypothetical protein
MHAAELLFSRYFGLAPKTLRDYGALDVSMLSDLPFFVDPFLLFNSNRSEYQALHAEILKYLDFLATKAAAGPVAAGVRRALFEFNEVKQNWLGFTLLGNAGHGVGPKFAKSLEDNMHRLATRPAAEFASHGRHLEKARLIGAKVGRDGISDFTVNLIAGYLAEYTQTFTL